MSYRPSQGYTDAFYQRWAADQAAAKAEQEEMQRANAEARARYLAGLEAKKLEEKQRAEAAIEAELAPQKERAKRQWLYDHPDKEAKDFERNAWPLLKANLLEEQDEQRLQAEIEAQRRRNSGRYSI